MLKRFKKPVALMIATLIVLACIPIQSAFASTQSVIATGNWRIYNSDELDQLAISTDSNNDMVGNPTVADANPPNASNPLTGWTPNGATDDRLTDSWNVSIVLDMPKVDLGCSSNVEISITSGEAEVLTSDVPSGIYGWTVVNSYNESLNNLNGPIKWNSNVSDPFPNTGSLISSLPVSPQAPAFGLKIIVTVGAWYSGVSSWDVHDLAVQYTYDDEGGLCSGVTAPAVATSCNNSYLDVQGINIGEDPMTTLSGMVGAPVITTPLGADPNQITSSTGFTFNSDQDETASNVELSRAIELNFTPQTPLSNAGTAQLRVDYDVNFNQEGYAFALILPGDGSFPIWAQVGYVYQIGHQTATTYLPSSELDDAQIYLIVSTKGDQNEQYTMNISNATVSVSHLNDVSVCGVSLNNSGGLDPDVTATTIPSGVAQGVGGAGGATATLPETGTYTTQLFIAALMLIVGGIFVTKESKSKETL